MLILRNQDRMLIGVLLLVALLLAGASVGWYRLQLERPLPPAGALLVRTRGLVGA